MTFGQVLQGPFFEVCEMSGHDILECLQVRRWIAQMKANSQAFYSDNCYLLAGVLLSKTQPDKFVSGQLAPDLTEQVLSVLTALH